MKKIDIKIKRINSVHVKGTRYPCYFILDENNETYQYIPRNNNLSSYMGSFDKDNCAELTLSYLILVKPGDIMSVEINVIDVKEGENTIPINKIKNAVIKYSVSTD